jgi:protein SCO1/2
MNRPKPSPNASARAHLGGAVIALAIASITTVGLAGCSRRPAALIEAGSYPAANPNDCLPNVTLIDQRGRNVTLSSLKGRPVLIDFIYTTCPGPCPLMTSRMAVVAKRLGPQLGRKVTFVSITIDPEHDRPPQLLKYAHEAGADEQGWLFLTGTPAQIAQVMALYRLRSERNKDGTIQHSVASFLLGPDGHQIRQYAPLEVEPSIVVADIERALSRG